MTFYERLQTLIKEKHLSFNRVERDLGYPRNALSNYKHDRTPNARRVAELAIYFSVSIPYLLGETDNKASDHITVRFDKLTEVRQVETLKFVQEKLREQEED